MQKQFKVLNPVKENACTSVRIRADQYSSEWLLMLPNASWLGLVLGSSSPHAKSKARAFCLSRWFLCASDSPSWQAGKPLNGGCWCLDLLCKNLRELLSCGGPAVAHATFLILLPTKTPSLLATGTKTIWVESEPIMLVPADLPILQLPSWQHSTVSLALGAPRDRISYCIGLPHAPQAHSFQTRRSSGENSLMRVKIVPWQLIEDVILCHLMWVSCDTMSFDVRPVLMKLMQPVQMYSNSEIWMLIVWWWPNSLDCNRLSNTKSWFLMLWWRYSPSDCTDLSNT